MASTSFTRSSLTNITKYDDFLVGNAAYNPSSFESIATVTATAGATSISFTSIPGTYQYLQVRGWVKSNGAFYDGGQITMRLNNDTTSNYSKHSLRGNGSSASASGAASQTSIEVGGLSSGTNNADPLAMIIDLHDYASTSKYKTVRGFEGVDNNGSGEVCLISGLWMSTSAVNQITLNISSQVAAGSTFALYGVKG